MACRREAVLTDKHSDRCCFHIETELSNTAVRDKSFQLGMAFEEQLFDDLDNLDISSGCRLQASKFNRNRINCCLFMKIMVNFDTMIPNVSIAPTQSVAAQALLAERLGQLESSLLEARGRVVGSMDRELASIRGWLDVLQNFDPNHSLPKPGQGVSLVGSGSALSELEMEPPPSAASNIVPFSASDFQPCEAPLPEPATDPTLEQATVDELNAALAAVFKHMEER